MNYDEEINNLKSSLIKANETIIENQKLNNIFHSFFIDIGNRLDRMEESIRELRKEIDNDVDCPEDVGSISIADVERSVKNSIIPQQPAAQMEISYIS